MRYRAIFICLLFGSVLFSAPEDSQEGDTKDSLVVAKINIDQLLPKSSQEAIGLRELFKRAKKNYQLIAKDDGIAQADAERLSALLEFGPTFSMKYDYRYQTTPSIGGGSYYGGNGASVTANWELYSGFSTLNKVKQKEALHRGSIADRNFTEQNLYLQIIQQYYAYFTNYSNLISLQQKKKLLQNNVERLKELYSSGLTTIDDLESLKAEASLTDYQIAQKELEVEQNRLNLSLLTNSEVVEIQREDLRFPDINTRAERSDIVALQEQAISIDYQRRQLSYAPKINLYNTFSYNDTFGDAIRKSAEKNQNIVGVSVSMSLDSLSLFKRKEAIGLSQMKALKELSYKKEEQKRDIELYKKSLDIARIKVNSAEAGLKSATLTFDNVSKRYDAQLVNYVDYLNALSQKFTAEATYVESLNNYEMQKANFAFFSGQDLEKHIR